MNKVIYNSRKINWFNITPNEFELGFKSIGATPFPLDEYSYLSSLNNDTFIDVDIGETYLGFSLYNLTIYSICNELVIFKDELSIGLHKEVVIKWFSLAKIIIDDLVGIFAVNKFSLVIIINGHSLLDACLLEFAKKYKYPFLSIENTSNKAKIVWDNVTGKVVTFNLAKIYFYKLRDKVKSNKVEKYAHKFKCSVFENKKEEHLSNVNNSRLPFAEPYVLFLGQVYCDAAQLFALEEGFKNPIEIIKETISVCVDNNINLVIKLHPKEISGVSPVVEKLYNMPTYKRIKAFESNNIEIDYDNRYNTFELIERSRFVVTMNSQAGLEACLYDKPVFTYDNCFFSNLGFTYDYSNAYTLKRTVTFLIENEINHNKNLELAKKFFFIFFEVYCISSFKKHLFYKILKSGSFTQKIWLNFIISDLKKRMKPYKCIFKKVLEKGLNRINN